MCAQLMDLNQHYSIVSAKDIKQIVKPLVDLFALKHFRYLKLYNDGSRILLSNDVVRW